MEEMHLQFLIQVQWLRQCQTSAAILLLVAGVVEIGMCEIRYPANVVLASTASLIYGSLMAVAFALSYYGSAENLDRTKRNRMMTAYLVVSTLSIPVAVVVTCSAIYYLVTCWSASEGGAGSCLPPNVLHSSLAMAIIELASGLFLLGTRCLVIARLILAYLQAGGTEIWKKRLLSAKFPHKPALEWFLISQGSPQPTIEQEEMERGSGEGLNPV